ncbi:AfsR/SARP family transcriptional regulator [Pseudonocardia charpentierae]|uniref:BTAD domain-containing putative transcriptional regulator n=1 Tax=Pseudonocardia charpentierae TaxID=3075545 RepID=A0ABU2NGI9_9PSEU|nr:BTAD domain-containing putative transcriptional regulator [Pseudonocardia sp. DSM 45834]MDT0352840.1 BTAD domain-containing putative transcriptional regulator [Pseudonocardia sp. DSM 45834]
MSVTAAPPTVRFRDLGTLLVEHDGDLRPVGGTRLDSALAVLLVHADRRVGPEAMAAALWGADAPPRSSSTLDSHVWRLRKVLEPHRARGVPSSLLLSDHGGYRLVVTVDQVDSLRFEQLAADAADLLAGGQPDRALRRADQALALWRGRPFTPITDEPWAASTVARLEELRSQTQERRVEALIAVGDPERALVELEPAIAEEPLREGLWAHRMWAYHCAGRTDRALTAYREVRALLRDELGVEPGAELRGVHARILAEDPVPAGPCRRAADEVPPAVPVPVVPAAVRLPVRRTPLVGRDAELARLTGVVTAHALTTVVGTAGCGKTRLATEVARATAATFPDGVWYVSLTSAVDAAGVLDAVASAVGVAVPAAGSAPDALRTLTRERRMLLLLDNCEHVLDDAAQLVEDLLVEGSEMAVLATSREPLHVEGEHVEHLHPLALPAPDARDPAAAPAVALFLQRLPTPPGRLTARSAEDLAYAAAIATAVDGVPLALELAAARARACTLAEITAQVTADPSSLARIGRAPPGRPGTVREAIDGSYRLLPADEARMHRLLSAAPGPFTADLATALVGTPDHRFDVVDRLTRLVHRSLLEPLGPLRPGGLSRFAQLATVRGHAGHAAEHEGDEGREAAERRDRWTEGLVRGRPRLGVAAERAWLEAVDDDLAAVRATLQHSLVDAPAAAGVRSMPFLALYWYYRGMFVEGRRWLERAVAEEERASPLERGLARLLLGGFHCLQNRGDLAAPHLNAGMAALGSAVDDANPLVVGDTLAQLAAGPLYVVADRRRLVETVAHLDRLTRRTGDEYLGLFTELGALHVVLVDAAPAATDADLLSRCADLHNRADALGNNYVAWITAMRTAVVCLAAGAPAEGLRWSDRMIAKQLALGNRNAAAAFGLRANLLAAAGEADRAVRLYAATRSHHRFNGLSWPRDDLTRTLLEWATARLDRRAADRASAEGSRLTLADLARDL